MMGLYVYCLPKSARSHKAKCSTGMLHSTKEDLEKKKKCHSNLIGKGGYSRRKDHSSQINP